MMTFHAFVNANSADLAALDVLSDADSVGRNVRVDAVYRVDTHERAETVADGFLAVHPAAIVLSYGAGRFGPMAVFHVVGTIDRV